MRPDEGFPLALWSLQGAALRHPASDRPCQPHCEGAMAVPGAVSALGHGTRPLCPPLVATRHTAPLTGLPTHAVLMRRAPLMACREEHPHAE